MTDEKIDELPTELKKLKAANQTQTQLARGSPFFFEDVEELPGPNRMDWREWVIVYKTPVAIGAVLVVAVPIIIWIL